ncbi:MAG TPA: efflux RND transporter periplasmic adaptor subunit [Gemmatimonadaceae bacterium]|nr:efflux RND transporter periplasmic adaptor subunit [Gemmatimonadaceae bacterium]
MSRRTKWSIGIIALLLIVGVVGLTAARGGNKAVEVRIEPVQKRDLVASVTASGKVEPRTKVDLSADITGRIVRLSVKEGQMVAKGQFLLEIDPAVYQAAVERQGAALAAARAEAVRAKASYDNAASQYNRLNEIKKSNPTLIADEEIERVRTTADVNHAAYEAARHNVAQTEATVRDARSNLAKTVIVAPMAGRVTRLNVELGETAIMGTLNKDAATLLTISDMSVLETKVKVDETDVARISVGDSAIVEIDAFPDTTFVGKVVEISNSSVISPTTGQPATDQAVDYEVRVQLMDPPAETRPDFSTTAKIITATRQAVLSIPIIALTVREHEPNENRDSAQVALGRRNTKEVGQRDVEGVFVVGADSKVTFRPVKIGIAGEEYFEVMSGLTDGEKIVAGSYQAIRELKEGTVVRETKKADAKKDGAKAGAKT